MKASRMIELLAKTIEKHGDLDVVTFDRCTECDGFVRKVTVRMSDENGDMPYCTPNGSVIGTPETEYVVLFSDD